MVPAPIGTALPDAGTKIWKSADSPGPSLRFSILTPTYNRAHTLPRLYMSLEKQSFADMEWIIVDDGSIDDTASIVSELAAKSSFPIRYFYQENRHKKSAVNKCVAAANGLMSTIVDSDDELADEALHNFWETWQSLPEPSRQQLVGIRALCCDQTGRIIGSAFPSDGMESTPSELQFRHRVKGDKASCERTKILKSFPYNDDVNGFVMEGTVWNEIGKHHQTVCFNFVAKIVHFEADSLTNSEVSLDVLQKCEGLSYSYAKMLDDNMQWFCYAPFAFIKMAINWSRFTIHARSSGQKYFHPKTFFALVFGRAFLPFGWLRYQIDNRRLSPRL